MKLTVRFVREMWWTMRYMDSLSFARKVEYAWSVARVTSGWKTSR
jgi:hypothetical protein